MEDREPTSYIRIADEIRRRIVAGELGEGDRVPSTREITREWGVAMATASKVLTTLARQGLVTAVPGVGTVVAPARRGPQPGAARQPHREAPRLSHALIVRTAIDIADAEGVESLTMRRIGGELGVAAMSLYRHVPGKDELLRAMGEEVFHERPLPERPPPGWRARLELAARREWAMYRRHMWLAEAISLTRPLASPAGMAHTEWMMSAVDGLGLTPDVMARIVITISGHVRASALLFSDEAETELQTGVTTDEWWNRRVPDIGEIMASGRYPLLASVSTVPSDPADPDPFFEFGLQRLLDGIAAFLPKH